MRQGRCFGLSQQTNKMNELQKHDLEVLKYFKQFTEENQLQYTLINGTLLGAIRHKGFIPWDDDIDVAMLPNDYKKFEKLFMESDYSKDGMSFQSRKIYKYQSFGFCKIRSKSLNVKERLPKTQKGNYGPWIDIFPLYKVPEDLEEQKKHYEAIKRYDSIIKKTLLIQVEPTDTGIRKVMKYIVQKTNEIMHPLYFFLPIVFRKREALYTKYNDTDSNLCANVTFMYLKTFEQFQTEVFKVSDIENIIEGEFEGESFNIPANYDDVLTTNYGDYMTIPKEEDRKVHKIEKNDN